MKPLEQAIREVLGHEVGVLTTLQQQQDREVHRLTTLFRSRLTAFAEILEHNFHILGTDYRDEGGNPAPFYECELETKKLLARHLGKEKE